MIKAVGFLNPPPKRVETPDGFDICTMFNISPILSFFFGGGEFFTFEHFQHFPGLSFYCYLECRGSRPPQLLTFLTSLPFPQLSTFFEGLFTFLAFLTFPLFQANSPHQPAEISFSVSFSFFLSSSSFLFFSFSVFLLFTFLFFSFSVFSLSIYIYLSIYL